MISISLPDGKHLEFDKPVSVKEIAEKIGMQLAKASVAAKIDEETLVDLTTVVDHNVKLELITLDSKEGLDIIRHSTAHLLAHAVKTLFPSAQITIGPVIENGFYYDISYEKSFTLKDFEKLEEKMREFAKQDLPIQREVMPREEAVKFFESMGEHYKAEIINEMPEGEIISLYRQGDFVDLCRGPHVPSTSYIKAFKLLKLAGAYWRGDSSNEMLQRIYGTAFATQKELDAYLECLAEAEKRNHRKIGKELNFFHFQDEAPGLPFWHDKGWTLFRIMENYMRRKLQENDYQEVRTPLFADRKLWEKSGHWEKFKDNMFTILVEDREYAIKPMNCPFHIQIFNQGLKSYRDLPLRIGEFGTVYRNEASGTLHGLMRTREMCQDDAHVFCTEAQMQSEVIKMIELVYKTYKDFGFLDVEVKLATRPEKRIGTDEKWEHGEKALDIALNTVGVKFEFAHGEGAFYGPKIEFHIRDSLNRDWQLGTVQIDFFMPERLEAQYVTEDGSRQTPIMIHRAILGSINRFMGVLIEHYAGKLPFWLSPVQIAVMNITDDQADYAKQVVKKLRKSGIRVILDLRNEKIGLKIRTQTLQRIPYMLIVGNREKENAAVAVRTCEGKDLGVMSVEKFILKVSSEAAAYK